MLNALTSTRDATTAIDEVLGYRCAAVLLVGLTLSGAAAVRYRSDADAARPTRVAPPDPRHRQ